MPDEKPFADVRRRRYDETSARSGLNGHTGRRYCGCSTCQEMLFPHLKRSHTESLFQRGSGCSYEQLENTVNRLIRPYACTRLEMNGGRVGLTGALSLNRHKAWEEVPALLTQSSVALPEVSIDSNGMIVTAYHLETTHEQLPDPQVAEHQEFLRTKIFQVRGERGRRNKPRLWATLATEAPPGIELPLLPFARLHCAGSTQCVAVGSVVRNRQRSWDVAGSNGRPLDIDLGATCLITHFSTQGRHPEIRLYPRVTRVRVDDGGGSQRRSYATIVEDHADHPPNEPYRGPTCTVLRTGLEEPSRAEPLPLAWVTRYELLWRADSGRMWHSLGEFRGNSDPTTEVAHSFTDAQGGGLMARYLRVRPLECEGGGAMRLGVYGLSRRSDGNCTVAGHARDVTDNPDQTPQYVTYHFKQPRPTVNRRYSRHNPMYKGGYANMLDLRGSKHSFRNDRKWYCAAVADMEAGARDAEAEMHCMSEVEENGLDAEESPIASIGGRHGGAGPDTGRDAREPAAESHIVEAAVTSGKIVETDEDDEDWCIVERAL